MVLVVLVATLNTIVVGPTLIPGIPGSPTAPINPTCPWEATQNKQFDDLQVSFVILIKFHICFDVSSAYSEDGIRPLACKTGVFDGSYRISFIRLVVLTLSFLRVINVKFILQPQPKYHITQYGELGFSQLTQMRNDYMTN